MNAPKLVSIDEILDIDPYDAAAESKYSFLLRGLNELTAFHRTQSQKYRGMVDSIFGAQQEYSDINSLPWLPVRLFKMQELISVPRDSIVRTLVSSGTTGQAVSKIFLDKQTSASQTKALAKIAAEFIGRKRLPMFIIDEDSFLRDRSKFSARAAGIVGFSNLGRDHYYALNEALEPNWSQIQQYVDRHRDKPILLFGFTFIVWQQFLQRARTQKVELKFPEGSVLVHGGGWKKLLDTQVSNDEFKSSMRDVFNIARVHNYYGMVEQVGSIFFECEHGTLHAPGYADIIVRDQYTFEPVDNGVEGLIQVLSLLPRSYPGHSLLTEDLGTIHGEDDCPCGRKGKRFSVAGRLPNVEVRGCSDTRVTPDA